MSLDEEQEAIVVLCGTLYAGASMLYATTALIDWLITHISSTIGYILINGSPAGAFIIGIAITYAIFKISRVNWGNIFSI